MALYRNLSYYLMIALIRRRVRLAPPSSANAPPGSIAVFYTFVLVTHWSEQFRDVVIRHRGSSCPLQNRRWILTQQPEGLSCLWTLHWRA